MKSIVFMLSLQNFDVCHKKGCSRQLYYRQYIGREMCNGCKMGSEDIIFGSFLRKIQVIT